jgi:hypothetical protein
LPLGHYAYQAERAGWFGYVALHPFTSFNPPSSSDYKIQQSTHLTHPPVKILDLSHIVHQSTKATTARLLNRTKPSLETFIAPQASFAINCWASLSKCKKLRILNLSLISESISYQSLNQTIRQLPQLAELHLPRCGRRLEDTKDTGEGHGMQVQWPPRLEHLSLSGSVHGKFMWDMLNTPHHFPSTLYSLNICHTPSTDHALIKTLLETVAGQLTHVTLRDLPAVKQGRLNGVLEWLPNLTDLTIATDYIDEHFGYMPAGFNPTMWPLSKPLTSFTLLTSGAHSTDPSRAFTPVDLFTLIDERFLGRLRYLNIAQSTGWATKDEGSCEVEALESALCELDKENWENRRWHYEGLGGGAYEGVTTWEEWVMGRGRSMRPRMRVPRNR